MGRKPSILSFLWQPCPPPPGASMGLRFYVPEIPGPHQACHSGVLC